MRVRFTIFLTLTLIFVLLSSTVLQNRTNAYGNQFRYRARVKDSRPGSVGHWAWDVFFVAP